jgi:hypothetical protein
LVSVLSGAALEFFPLCVERFPPDVCILETAPRAFQGGLHLFFLFPRQRESRPLGQGQALPEKKKPGIALDAGLQG